MRAITTLPEILVVVEGLVLGDRERATLAGVRVQHRLSVPTLCELSFFDPPGDFDVGRRIGVGSALQVAVAGQRDPLFSGEVTAVEHVYEADRGFTVRVRGYDLLHRLRKRQEVRTFSDVTAADLLRRVAGDAGLGVSTDLDGPRWPRLTQHSQTDLELLQEVAAAAGAYFTAHDGTVHLITLEGRGAGVELEVGRSLVEATFSVNADRSARQVTAVGWDPGSFEVHRRDAASARSGRRVAAGAAAADAGGVDSRVLPDRPGASADHVAGDAQAELDDRTAAEVTVWGVAEGDARLRPGVPILVHGAVAEMTGQHILTSVVHTIDEGGYLTEFSTEPPADRRPRRPATLTPGVGVDVADPEGLARVKVELPTHEGVETEWLQVLLPAAGEDKGIVALPDVGDNVLLLFPHGDPARGVVLGSVYGTTRPPDDGVSGSSIKRYTLTTRGGQVVTLDDDERRVRVENTPGSFLQLEPDEVRLHAETDLVIEAPGRRLTIIADAIDFERG